jgi:uncharacterized protein
MEKSKLVPYGLILGLCMVASAGLVSQTLLKVKRMDANLLVSAGSARMAVVSDSVKWRGNFSRVVAKTDLNMGHIEMRNDEAKVMMFLTDNGIKAEDVTVTPVFTGEIWKSDANLPKEYNLIQNVEVRSVEVEKVRDLAKNAQGLINEGVFFSTDSLEYYYTKLPEARINLLPESIKDARMRADKIAEAIGKKVVSVQSVNMGVVQVLAPNSVDISDYGSYDTGSIEKDIMVTVKPTFVLQ